MPIPNKKKAEIAGKVLPIWVERFPSTFAIWRTTPKPLKVGIHKDLRAAFPDTGRAYIGVTLQRYTHTRRYLECLVEGAERVDLDGTVVGAVTAEHATLARKAHAELLAHRAVRDARIAKQKSEPKQVTA